MVPPVISVGPLNSLTVVVRHMEDRERSNSSRALQGGSDSRGAVARLDQCGLIRRRVAERVGQIARSSGVIAWEGKRAAEPSRDAETRLSSLGVITLTLSNRLRLSTIYLLLGSGSPQHQFLEMCTFENSNP